MSLNDAGQWATIVTAAIAVLAVFVAWLSISAQRKIARCSAAVDFFMKTEMDNDMINAFRESEKAIKELQASPSIEAFVQTDLWRPIQRYLNVHELMAVAVHTRIFDQRICYSFWADILTKAHRDTEKLIAYRREEAGGAGSYEDLLRLHRRWSGRRWIWQRWRS
jgi:hypothetical protein